MAIFFSVTGPNGENHASPHLGRAFVSICSPTVMAQLGGQGVYEIPRIPMPLVQNGRQKGLIEPVFRPALPSPLCPKCDALIARARRENDIGEDETLDSWMARNP
jgi:hypothetical protein